MNAARARGPACRRRLTSEDGTLHRSSAGQEVVEFVGDQPGQTSLPSLASIASTARSRQARSADRWCEVFQRITVAGGGYAGDAG